MRFLRPSIIVPIFCLIYLIVIAVYAGHVYVWVTPANDSLPPDLAGYGYSKLGYDGYHNYLIARNPVEAIRYIYEPSYRFQRILLAAIARVLSFGNRESLPYILVTINLIMLGLGTWAVEILLKEAKYSIWYALGYGLSFGIFASARLSMTEPLAYGLAVWGVVLMQRKKWLGAAALFSMAALSKETTLFFPAAYGFYMLYQRKWLTAIIFGLISLLPIFLWEAAVYWIFGKVGAVTDGASRFEFIPFGAYFKMLQSNNFPVLSLYTILYILFIFIPIFWGLWRCWKDFQAKSWTPATQVMLFNILIIPFIPFTTFSEINGILRFVIGMQIAIIWYAASKRMLRPLRFTSYWAFSCLFIIVSDYYVLSGVWQLPS
jgi:hypothetical protein